MIKIFKYIISWIAFVSSVTLSCFAQTLPGIQNSFNNYAQNNLQEKLFVHTDRQDYLTGEIIWFKIYAVDGIYNKPLNLSRVAYVEILDKRQNPVMEAKIALNDGSGTGSLLIPISVANGNYKLRAYTSWMKNFSPDFYFEKLIRILNPQVIPDAGTKQVKASYDIQFFPEGGNLVSGVKSKVAFKGVGADGKGIDLKGAIINQKNDTVARFASLKFGMGSFSFTPAKDDNYKAIIQTPDNKQVMKALPPIAAEGYVMQLTDNSSQLDIAVSSISDPKGHVYIFAHTRQLVKLAKEADLDNGITHFLINKNLLDDGISHITLFNRDRQPICERLYFKKPTSKLLLTTSPDQQQYARRKKVNIALQAKDPSGILLHPNLSLSVYRQDALQTTPSEDILSYLWLSSDLVGSVESPGYYFSNSDADVDHAIDNLMLTQGWRRFDWKNILTNKQPAFSFLPETYGHIITGKITNTLTNEPAKDIMTYLGVPGKRVQLFVSKSDSSGGLLFNTKDLYGSEIVVQTNNQQDSTYRIDILKPFSEQYSKTPLPLFDIKPDTHEAIEKENFNSQVQNMYVGNKLKQVYEPLADSSGFFRRPFNTYLLDNYTRFITMEEVLREYVKEVNIVKHQKRFHIKVISDHGFLEGDPLVLVDGIPVFNIDKVFTIDPLVIRKLDIVPQIYFYGPSAYDGIFTYTSYKGNLGGVDIDPHAVVMDYEGLQMQRVFYSPVYETDNQLKSHLPDFRNLLFWSPSVSANGKSPVSFYTADQDGKYIGIVQGITETGAAASSYFTFEVKK